MKTLRSIISLLTLVCLLTFSFCSDDKPPEPTLAEVTTKQLTTSAWKLTSLTIDAVSDDTFFKGLTIAFTATGFTTTKGEPVWPTTGTWAFTDGETTARKIKRGDNIEVIIEEISDTSLTLSMPWTKTTNEGGRSSSIPGKHVFKFGK